MCFCSKSNRKALKLNEILEELDKWSDDEVFGTIYIAPPDNANANVTDEDSGDEDNVGLNNLPGGQLRAEAEIRHFDINDYESDDDSDDNIPLASLVKRKRVAEPRPTKKNVSISGSNRIWFLAYHHGNYFKNASKIQIPWTFL